MIGLGSDKYAGFLRLLLGESSKKRIFYDQADRKGVWSAQSALTVSKCENFDPRFSMEYDSFILKTHLSHCEGSQKCIFYAFNASAIPLSDRFVTEQQWQ